MKPDAMDKVYLAQTISALMEAYHKLGDACKGAQAAKNEKLFGMIYAKQWEVAELATMLIIGQANTEANTPECDDCGYRNDDLITKSNHHGGQKTVCRDRGLCHARGG